MAAKAKTAVESEYDVHPSIAYTQAIVDNLGEKTGKTMEQWAALCRKEGPKDEPSLREWLKKNHEVGGTTAWMIAERTFGKGGADTNPDVYLSEAPGYVAAMYAGKRAGLKPIHDALIAFGRTLGKDVKVCPCQTIVPLYRNHVFAQVKPATHSRIDFGLALKGVERKIPARLLPTGGLEKGDRITHRFAIASLAEIDAEVKDWARIAYAADA